MLLLWDSTCSPVKWAQHHLPHSAWQETRIVVLCPPTPTQFSVQVSRRAFLCFPLASKETVFLGRCSRSGFSPGGPSEAPRRGHHPWLYFLRCHSLRPLPPPSYRTAPLRDPGGLPIAKPFRHVLPLSHLTFRGHSFPPEMPSCSASSV